MTDFFLILFTTDDGNTEKKLSFFSQMLSV